MELHAQLATRLLEEHPSDAARALETIDPEAAAALLKEMDAERAGRVLRRIALHALSGILARLDPDALAAIASQLDLDVAARLLRQLPALELAAVAGRLPQRVARSLQSLLRFPEGSAGAVMDPEVLALPADLSVKEAVARIREQPELVRYNLYITGADHVLVGVINLRELLLARPQQTLRSIMNEASHRVGAHEDRQRIVGHPGWRDVHSLPVVDARGVFLGAVRYRTLRRLEAELRGKPHEGGVTARALGDLFATGAAGLLAALTEAGAHGEGDGDAA